MSVASIGTGIVPLQELPLEKNSAQKSQVRVEQRAVSLPGTNAAADLEKVSLIFNKRLQFVVDHESYNVTVKVIDRETDKVIKVLPPEELQLLHNKLKETIGFLFDQQV